MYHIFRVAYDKDCFRGFNAAASLKQLGYSIREVGYEIGFRGFNAAASLKLSNNRLTGSDTMGFRGFNAAASLKH